MLKPVFDHISKHLEARSKEPPAHRIFNSLLDVWKSGKTRSFVFNVFFEQLVPGYLGAVTSPRAQCIQFIEKDHTWSGIPGSLEHLSDGSLTLANILKYKTKVDRQQRSSLPRMAIAPVGSRLGTHKPPRGYSHI